MIKISFLQLLQRSLEKCQYRWKNLQCKQYKQRMRSNQKKYYMNGWNNTSKSTTDLEVFFCPFLSGSNFLNKQSMVQYLRTYHQGMSSEPQRKSRVNRKLVWLTSKIQCNLLLCRGIRESIMSIFCSLVTEDCNIFRSQSKVKTLESASQLPYRHMWRRFVFCPNSTKRSIM